MGCFVLGMSTRKVALTLVPLLGVRISPQLVSYIAGALDAQVAKFHCRPLRDRYRFLYFDGVVLRHKGAALVQRRFILTVLGITGQGKKELIDYMVSGSESQAAWEGFLQELYRRGLTGDGCQLVISDGNPGLIGALDLVYPRIERQHCWAHKMRNVLDKVRKRDQAQVKRALQAISNAPNRTAATHASRKEREGLSLEERDHDRRSLWRKSRTTNIIERAFREVKRRTRPMGVFMNKQSMERILFAVFHHFNHKEDHGPLFAFTEEY